MNAVIAPPGQDRPVVLRIKRRRDDISENHIILEAAAVQESGSGASSLRAQLGNLGLDADARGDDRPKKRRFCQRVREIGVADFWAQAETETSKTILDLYKEVQDGPGAPGGQAVEDSGSSKPAPSESSKLKRDHSGSSVAQSEYQQVAKRVRKLDGDMLKPDALQTAFRVYDFEKVSVRTGPDADGGTHPAEAAAGTGGHQKPEADANGKGTEGQGQQHDYVYDIYCVKDCPADDIAGADQKAVPGAPVIQVEQFFEDILVGGNSSRSSFDSEDSNDQDYYANDYPDEDDDSEDDYDDTGFRGYSGIDGHLRLSDVGDGISGRGGMGFGRNRSNPYYDSDDSYDAEDD